MDEKKLTDEEIVKAWECHINGLVCDKQCPYKVKGISCLNGQHVRDTIDLIHRLQEEVKEKKRWYDIARDELFKQKAEIERLTEEADEMFDRHAKENQAASILIEQRNNENAELQKQVDECNRDCENYAIENGELQQ